MRKKEKKKGTVEGGRGFFFSFEREFPVPNLELFGAIFTKGSFFLTFELVSQ